MRFKKKTNLGWGARIGFGKGETKHGRYRKLYHAPVMIYRTTGKQRLMLETGLGATFARTDTPYHINSVTGIFGNYIQRENNVIFIGNLGLRAQALKTGAIARIYWSPIFGTLNANETYLLWFGASVGFSIK
jgi:hypothetical protein